MNISAKFQPYPLAASQESIFFFANLAFAMTTNQIERSGQKLDIW